MGNCLCTGQRMKKKKNRVAPSPEEEAEAQPYRPSSCHLFQVERSPSRSEELAKQINHAKEALSFTVDFKEGDSTRMPSRLADRINGTSTPESESKAIQYTSEEKELLADMLKADVLEERRQKACRQHRHAQVAERRAVLAMEKEFRAKSALDKETPCLVERRRKVKIMADQARASAKASKTSN